MKPYRLHTTDPYNTIRSMMSFNQWLFEHEVCEWRRMFNSKKDRLLQMI